MNYKLPSLLMFLGKSPAFGSERIEVSTRSKAAMPYFRTFLAAAGLIVCFLNSPPVFAQGIDVNKNIEDSVVATVGTRTITAKEFAAGYEFGPAFPKREKNSKKIYLNYMINEKLLAIEGGTQKFDTTQTFKDLYSDICADIATEELYKQVILPKISVPENEIADALTKKNTEIYLRWIFCKEKEEASAIQKKLIGGHSFDTLFDAQLHADSLFRDERTFKTNKFKLWQKNPALASIADTLRVGAISKPIHAGDGWYIVRIDSVVKVFTLSEGEYDNDRVEVTRAITMKKMDEYSDKYVDSLLRGTEPVIDGKAFQIVRTYVGKFELPNETFEEWNLQKLYDKAYSELSGNKKTPAAQFTLVRLNDTVFTVGDFIGWYNQRVDYLKFPKTDKKAFSATIESLIWRMVRDNILTSVAARKGMMDVPSVKAQAEWWKDKILYALVRDELGNTLTMKNSDQKQSILKPKSQEDMSTEINKILFRKINALKNKYKITINDAILNKVVVRDENNPKAIDMYIVKKGGIYPHPAFPSIDKYWQMWE
jgi:hypothetical protein